MVGITSTAQFIEQANPEDPEADNLGAKLDNIRNMACCGGTTAWKIADILFDTIMGFDNVSGTPIETAISSYLSSDEASGGVNFYGYETTGNTPDNYYSDIITNIVNLLSGQ